MRHAVIFTTASDPFTKSKASDLLAEVRFFRRNSSSQLALGLTHLMTGRDLDGDTVGIAYIGSVCQRLRCVQSFRGAALELPGLADRRS